MNLLEQAPWDSVEDARRSTSLADLSAVTSRYAHATGFNHFGFAIKFCQHLGNNKPDYHYFHNIPEPWGRYRYEETYASDAADRDPLVTHLRCGLPATAFNTIGTVTHTRPDIVRRGEPILRRANDNYGLKSGIFVPLSATKTSWSFMIMTSGDTSDVRDVIHQLPNFHFFAHHVHCMARAMVEKAQPEIHLRPIELEILHWAAIGKTSWEIGRITSLSERTVNFHLQCAAKKLAVSGRRAACAKALALGLMTL